MRKTPKLKTVTTYIAQSPDKVRSKLKELRTIVRKTAPGAQEYISYGMPHYGRLASFAAFKNHISLFIAPSIIEEHKRELMDYETTKAAIHFSPTKPLPVVLIQKLIRARMKKYEEKE